MSLIFKYALSVVMVLPFLWGCGKKDSDTPVVIGHDLATTGSIISKKHVGNRAIVGQEKEAKGENKLGEPLEEITLFDISKKEAEELKPLAPVEGLKPVSTPGISSLAIVKKSEPKREMEKLTSIPKIIPRQEFEKASRDVFAILEKIGGKEDFSKELSGIEALGFAACPKLIEVFKDDRIDWKKRWVAAMALGRIRTSESKETLLGGLKDKLSVMRMASIIALKHYPSYEVVDAIHEVFLKDKAMLVRNTAVDVLSEIGDPRSVSVFAKGLSLGNNFYRGRNLWIRNNIIKALGRSGRREAVPHLVNVIKGQDRSLYEDALRSLEHIMASELPKGFESTYSMDQRKAWWIAWWGKNEKNW